MARQPGTHPYKLRQGNAHMGWTLGVPKHVADALTENGKCDVLMECVVDDEGLHYYPVQKVSKVKKSIKMPTTVNR